VLEGLFCMAKKGGIYKLNPVTLLYEVEKVSWGSRVAWAVGFILSSLLLSLVYFWIYSSVLGLEPPKTALLKKKNADWTAKIELMNRQLDRSEATLEGLRMRDDEIYRNIFGMNEIAPEIRNAGFGGVNRYAYLDAVGDKSPLKRTAIRLDVLTKKAYVQSKSFDDIESMARKAGDMASCIPAIPPINPDRNRFRLSSPFGYRSDPISGQTRFHSGFDFAMKPGYPVYATGDGVVETVKYELGGYGNSIVIDHGFGYKTRYAHMKMIYVVEGMKLKRGECIGESGNTGKSTGPHLHYEVIYRDNQVNPVNYFDLDMSPEEYGEMVSRVSGQSEAMLGNGRFKGTK